MGRTLPFTLPDKCILFLVNICRITNTSTVQHLYITFLGSVVHLLLSNLKLGNKTIKAQSSATK